MEKLNYKLTYASLLVLAAGIFTSMSFSALGHIFIFIPAIYFSIKFYKERPFKLSPSYWALLGISITIALSIVFNTDIMGRPAKVATKLKYFLLPLLGLPAYYYTFKNYLDDKKIRLLLTLFVAATTIATVSGLVGLFSGFNPLKMKAACHHSRACGLYGMYMTYGYGISLFQVLLTGLILKRNFFKRYINLNFLYVAWVINFVGLILSYARGGWIAFIIAIPFFFFKKNKKIFSVAIISGVIILGASIAGSTTVRNMFLNRGHSDMQRIAFYQTAIKAFMEKPVFGWGYRNFQPNVIPLKAKYDIAYPRRGGHAHNNFFEHLASTGGLGALAFVIFSLVWLFEAYKTSLVCFGFVINFGVSGLFQYTFGDGENVFFMMVVWALGSIYYSLNKGTELEKV